MAKVSVKNIRQSSPSWMVNITGSLTGLLALSITMVNTMPASVPQSVKEWALWVINGIAGIATVFAGATMLTKKSDSTDPKEPPPNPKP